MRRSNKCVMLARATGKPKWLCDCYDGSCKFIPSDRSICPHIMGDDKCTSVGAHIEILKKLDEVKS